MHFYILLGALWLYPIIILLFFVFTKKRIPARKKVFRIILVVTAITGISMASGICTRFNAMNWLLFTVFYFFVLYLCWWSQFVAVNWVRWLGLFPLAIVLVAGYFSGSVGALGIAFATYRDELRDEVWVNKSLSVKVYKDSNVFSEKRSATYQVYKTLWWNPLLQRKIAEKTYYKMILIFADKPAASYNPAKEEIYLHVSMKDFKTKQMVYWADTIRLAN